MMYTVTERVNGGDPVQWEQPVNSVFDYVKTLDGKYAGQLCNSTWNSDGSVSVMVMLPMAGRLYATLKEFVGGSTI